MSSMWQRQHAILVCIFLLFFQCFFSDCCFFSFIHLYFYSFLSFLSFLLFPFFPFFPFFYFLSFLSFFSFILKIFQGKYLENFSKTLKFSFEIFSFKIFFILQKIKIILFCLKLFYFALNL